MEKMHRFSHFGNNSIDSERPDIKFFKTGLICPYIFAIKIQKSTEHLIFGDFFWSENSFLKKSLLGGDGN